MRTAGRTLTVLLLTLALAAGLLLPAGAREGEDGWRAALDAAVEYALDTRPRTGTGGGEWTALALARSGAAGTEDWLAEYWETLEETVAAAEGVLSQRKYTEYARAVLAVTALGEDPRDVAGYDLLASLGDWTAVTRQGVNGAAFALIALDCGDYPVPAAPEGEEQTSREGCVDYLLERELPGGGWALSGTEAEADVTAMVLQALAPYAGGTAAGAVERGLARLEELKGPEGQYALHRTANAESTAQAVIALCTLGEEPGEDVVAALLSFQLPDGSFSHVAGGGSDPMATEQALCALAALARQAAGESALYDMAAAAAGGPVPRPVTLPGATFDDIQGHPDQEDIEALASRGIAAGTGEGLFQPGAAMTRAEFAAMVVSALSLTPDAGAAEFADVVPDAWYAPFVGAATEVGVTAGTGEGTFSPEETIPLEQAAVMVARAAALCGLDTAVTPEEAGTLLAAFPDGADCSHWAREGVAFCVRAGILDGGTLQPGRDTLRCDMARMLTRLLDGAGLLV